MGFLEKFFEKKKCDVGICVATSYCNKKKREKDYTVFKGTLVKFIEYFDYKVIFTPVGVKDDVKLVTLEHANFEWIDEDLYKYLYAIKDPYERIKFYKNIDRREFVLHLKEDTFVGVQFSKLQIKALFKRFIVNDKKKYISVELVEPPTNLSKKELEIYSHNSSQYVYHLPANMIRKYCFIDVDRKIEENLIIDKTLWRCDVCHKINFKYMKKCDVCSSYNPIEDSGNHSSSNVNRNKCRSGMSWNNNEEDTKLVYPSNECYDQSYIDCFESKPMRETDYSNGDFNQSDVRINKKRRNHEVSNDITVLNDSCIASILEVSFKQGQDRFQDTYNHSELSISQSDKYNFNGPVGFESTKIYCDPCVKEHKDLSKNPLDIKPVISNTKMGLRCSKLDKNYQVFPDQVMEVPLIKPGLIGMWRCATCLTKNDKPQCVECGDAYDIDHRTSWSCAICTSVNNYENNICHECGDNRGEISNSVKTQACVDPNLLVSTRLSSEMPMNPFETTNKSSDNNNVTNPDDDLMEHHDFLVLYNISDTNCCFCKKNIIRLGIVLLLCEHAFCETCVNNHIISEQKCLAVTNNKPCERRLELSEIKCLLSSDKYKEFCAYLINLKDSNSYIERCYNKNCTGYYLWEKYYAVRPTEFRCNECKLNNCMRCAAIHVGLTCEKYKKLIGDGKSIDKETIEMFLTMIREGIAMQCPSCETLIEKDEGCDWIQCPLCHTEICWATRGPRWGPNGKDDTSGGCGCTKEKLCVPSCNYCH